MKQQTIIVYFIGENTKINANMEMAAIQRVKAALQGSDEICIVVMGNNNAILDGFKDQFKTRGLKFLWGTDFADNTKLELYEPDPVPQEVSIYT